MYLDEKTSVINLNNIVICGRTVTIWFDIPRIESHN